MLKILKLRFIRTFILVATLCIAHPGNIYAIDLSWMYSGIAGLGSFFQCVEVPAFNSFNTGGINLSVADGRGQWISTGQNVAGDQTLKIDWSTSGITSRPRKYMVMYRVDPRFQIPQTFILKYDYISNTYISDFHTFKNGELPGYQTMGAPNLATIATEYNSYFTFGAGRETITLDPGDVLNITLSSMPYFLSQSQQFGSELDNTGMGRVTSIATSTGLTDNSILYVSSQSWCALESQSHACIQDPTTGAYLYSGVNRSYRRFIGIMEANNGLNTFSSCPANTEGLNLTNVCVYDHGRGMKMVNGSKEIKSTYTPFISSTFSGKDFFYYKAEESGDLMFSTDMQIDGMFLNFPQHMSSWGAEYNNSLQTLTEYLHSDLGDSDTMSQFLHLGRYIMLIEIGNSDAVASFTQQNDITLAYQVMRLGQTPAPGSTGTNVDTNQYAIDAPNSGILWFKVTNPNNEIAGTITVTYASYTGTTFLSDILYNDLALPIMGMLRGDSSVSYSGIAGLFYSGIATDAQWQLTVKTLLTLYIMFYGLFFLAGIVKISAMDLVKRIIKIVVVVSVFSPRSWIFFNEYVFTIFLDGMSYLAFSVVGATSSVNNLFGFVDIIFDKYTNPALWQLLIIQLLQFYNGMAYVSILMISAIIEYIGAVVEVIISYIMAFVGMCVMISLAPIFIVCMLFERTRGMFDNWMSLLFNYMIQPTILLIFFLLIDQLMTVQLSLAVVRACWDVLIALEFSLDLSPIGINYVLNVSIPFLPGIPFFVPVLVAGDELLSNTGTTGTLTTVAMAALMFKIYAQLAKGLLGYVTNVVAALTNVSPARVEGKAQQADDSAVGSIKSQIMAPVNSAGRSIKSTGETIKRKTWDGDFAAKGPDLRGQEDKKSIDNVRKVRGDD